MAFTKKIHRGTGDMIFTKFYTSTFKVPDNGSRATVICIDPFFHAVEICIVADAQIIGRVSTVRRTS